MPQCEAIVLIQANEEPKNDWPARSLPSTIPSAENPGGYGVVRSGARNAAAHQAEEAAKAKHAKKRDKLPSVMCARSRSFPMRKAGKRSAWGCCSSFAGTWIWLGCHILQGSYVLLGSVELPEYAALLVRNLEVRNNDGFPVRPRLGRGRAGDLSRHDRRQGIPRLRQAVFDGVERFLFLPVLLWMAGYGFLLPVPRRFGMFGQVLYVGAGGRKRPFAVFLQAAAGARRLWAGDDPLVTPEIAMTEYNMERMVPINILWSGAAVLGEYVHPDHQDAALSGADVHEHFHLVGRGRHQG